MNRIRALREDRDLNQEAVAKVIKTTQERPFGRSCVVYCFIYFVWV